MSSLTTFNQNSAYKVFIFVFHILVTLRDFLSLVTFEVIPCEVRVI